MKILQTFLLLLFSLVTGITNCQDVKSKFGLNYNSKESFYDKSILKTINEEMRFITRSKHDSVLVFIEDKHFTDTKAYLIFKRKNKVRFFAFLFNTLQKKYCVVEFKLLDQKFADIVQYYRLVKDSFFTKINNPLVSISENFQCNLYLGMGNQDFEIRFQAQNFENDKKHLFEFVSNTYKTRLYQNILSACDKFYKLGLGTDFRENDFIRFHIKNY